MKTQKTREALCQPKVQVKAVTWNKDSHGLFDYESKSLSHKRFLVDSSTRVYRNSASTQGGYAGNEVDTFTLEELRKKSSLDPTNTQLAEIEKRQGAPNETRYFIKVENAAGMEIEEDPNDSVYLIVRSLKNKQGEQKGYPLEIDDIIKLGRIEYMVSEMKTQTGTLTSHKSDLDTAVDTVYEVHEELKGLCKICLVEEDDPDNFFVSPCSCKGSCSIVHLNCLKKWIESKMVVKQHAIAISYNFTKFECEICKDPYPKIIKKNQRGFELFVIERPTTPYIMLESLSQTQAKGHKTLYMIGASTGEKIKLGRGHQCEIRITDISVSREHAHIKYENDRFLILDNNSKFGTLIKLQKDLQIRMEKVAVQVGRTVVTCAIKYEDVSMGGKERSQKILVVSPNPPQYKK